MLSKTQCKKVLNKNGLFYNDEEIEVIRKVLYQIAEIEYKRKNQK